MMSSGNKKDFKLDILNKKAARELALALLYQKEVGQSLAAPEEWPILFDRSLNQDIIHWTHELIAGVESKKELIDQDIKQLATHWKLHRIHIIERNALRLGLYEMKYQDSPLAAAIVINEYVELAKRYGSQDSGAFVNGILDQAAKQISWQKNP